MILFPVRLRAAAGLPVVFAAGVVAASVLSPCASSAQTRTPESSRDDLRERVVVRREGPIFRINRGAPVNRAVLGVMMGEGSRADTAGVTLESVTENGPAAKAGLKAGDVLTSINGVSLKVAKEDAEDLALAGLAQRRLQRVMGKVSAGDDVTLQVQSGGRSRSVTVKAVSPQSLEAGEPRVVERVITRGPDGSVFERRSGAPRAMVGVTVGAAGNLRDTLGLFVSSVVSGGPAEKAGIIEGERIATVNGIDVRVPREDANDPQVVSSRVDRFVREVQQSEPGAAIRLRVYGNGRYRDVTVTAGEMTRPGELFEFNTDGPRGRVRIDGADIEIDGARIERAMQQMGRTLRERFNGVELELRDIPERTGMVRIMRSRAGSALL